jgi:5-methylcytosine-specific restriction endonuclease McrA
LEYACIVCGSPSVRGRRCRRHLLRERPRGNAFEPTRQRILERDGWRCQVRLEGCLGHATVVDHVVQLRDGGSDADSNLRAACEPCNLKRGAR